MTDRYLEWDAAYVLGALDPAERLEFEGHVRDCPRCAAAVAELAGMPGLLGQLEPGPVLALDTSPTAAGSERAANVANFVAPQRHRREPRRRWLLPAVAAGALLIGGAGGMAIANLTGTTSVAQSVGTGRLAFSPVGTSPMTAVVDLAKTADGTSLKVECQYPVDYRVGDPAAAPYSVWVVATDGTAERVVTWNAKAGIVMHPGGLVTIPANRITRVEIRRGEDGPVVMTTKTI